MTENRESLLSIRDFGVSFQRYDSRMGQTRLQVISNLHLTVYPGEILAVVGSSGSGKSLLALAILGMLPLNAVTGGEILYRGKELTPERQKQLRGKKIALVPQSVTFLDPLMKTGKQADGQGGTGLTQKRRDIFRRLGLPGKTENLYPFQLSGGMARRVLVSTALLTEAELILADEPTPGMSLEQALEALRMFREMAEEGRAVLLITHDLDLAVEFAPSVFQSPLGVPASKRLSACRRFSALCRELARGLSVRAPLPPADGPVRNGAAAGADRAGRGSEVL